MRLISRSSTRAVRTLARRRALAPTLATIGALALAAAARQAPAQIPVTKDPVTKDAAARPRPASNAPARAARPISLGDVAGRWAMRVMLMGGDSTLVTHELIATPDRAGWRLIFPNRDPIAAQAVAVAGDSIVSVFGPYESVLRSGVQVTTRSVFRLRNGRLYGTTVAQYGTHSPDSVLQVRSVGTRVR